MSDAIEPQPEKKKHSRVKLSVYWFAGILAGYVLSTGPLMLLEEKKMLPETGPVDQVIEFVYGPFEWASEEPYLRKPLGLYWHLWAPQRFDRTGTQIP